MELGFSRATALVTGAASGIGLAVSQAFASAGVRVVLTDLELTSATEAAAQLPNPHLVHLPIAWNIANPDQGKQVVEQLAAGEVEVSILVNNAGVIASDPIDGPDFLKHWHELIDVNLTGSVHAVRAMLPALRRNRGSIVNIGSVQSQIGLCSSAAAYGATKGGIAQLTRALAVDLASDGIRVNCVAPGFTDTAMTRETRSTPDRLAYYVDRIPLGRIGTPEEIADVVLFIASPMARYMTGAIVPVDGGMLAF